MVTDVLRLSEGMSYKNAMAGLELGGGKSVIWGDPRRDKSDGLLAAFGRAVASLEGRYYTAEDVGMTARDMAVIRTQTPFVAGLEQGAAASGDPSPLTARGVLAGIRQVALRLFGSDDLSGRTISVQGTGSVGGHLCDLLAAAGAGLVITDTDEKALARIAGRTGARCVAPDEIYDVQADIFAPCALGAVINANTVGRLKVRGIAGAANNQLIIPEMGEFLRRRGILYAPDYVINGGGIINVAAEISGHYAPEWVEAKLDRLIVTLGEVLDEALAAGLPTNLVADRMARQRIAAARRG
jgi:leucine dehydrogenase